MKPGDVAAITYGMDGFTDVALRVDPEDWAVAAGTVRDRYVTEVRPLTVIDRTDREQVGRLARLFHSAFEAIPYEYGDFDAELVKAGQAALDEFANPTPPEHQHEAEPLLLFARWLFDRMGVTDIPERMTTEYLAEMRAADEDEVT